MLFRIEREVEKKEQERELFKVRSESLERDLAVSATNLAAQTELLSVFREELRTIVRQFDEPVTALKRIKDKLKELPCESVDWVKLDKEFASYYGAMGARGLSFRK